tara:strand:+ start:181 stop:705 length:525 start_codon:yes stop_codon:yes gene_type:complete
MITIDGGTGVILNNGVEVASPKMVDHWRMTSDTTAGQDGVISNWAQVSTSNHLPGRIGSSMSVSSHIFTFPTTGIYDITASLAFFIGTNNDTIAQVWLKVSYDGTNYNEVASWRTGEASDSIHQTVTNNYILDVTNTSNVKFYFERDSFAGATELRGTSDLGVTNVTITRLGDT